MNTPNHPDDNNEAWESAMSRDFDARVRDLHEAPLDLSRVKGKAVTIRRNRRIAVAGGVLATAAVITPVAMVATQGGDDARDPGFAESPTQVSDTAAPDNGAGSVEYVHDGTWFRSDGTEVAVPDREYDAAALWNDQLVATRYDGEVYSEVDVIDGDGNVVDSFRSTSAPAVNEAGTTMAWIDTAGRVMTRWADDEVALDQVDLAAAGDSVAYSVAAISGGPACYEPEGDGAGCSVYVNNQTTGGIEVFDSHGVGDSPVEGMDKAFDVTESGLLTVIERVTDDLTACGGLYDLAAGRFRWNGCDFQAQEISPGGDFVVGTPSQGDGQGPLSISILDATTGEETPGRFAGEGGFVGHWAWIDGDTLAFTAYDGANWHLYALDASGETEEIDVVEAADMDFPYLLVQR